MAGKQQDIRFLKRAIQLSQHALKTQSGGPFGCVIVFEQKIIGQGFNTVISQKDPTAHAEMVAIRNACKNISSFQLDQCTLYTSCHPCLMCLGAIYWANIKKVVYANSTEDCGRLKFVQKNNDQLLYEDISNSFQNGKVKFQHIPLEQAAKGFENWMRKMNGN